MGGFRGGLYKLARILGDIEAISKGKAGKRVQRRITGKMAGRTLRSGGCFIATACYGSPLAEEVKALSDFRDNYLKRCLPGRVFIKVYYTISPPLAELIQRHKLLKSTVRFILARLVHLIAIFCH